MSMEYEWVDGYENATYTDDMIFRVDKNTKKLERLVNQPLISGEENSQFIRFEMPRYYDGVDLSTKNIQIIYQTEGGFSDINAAKCVERNDTTIRFGWLVPGPACYDVGTLAFGIEFVGTDYVLKTRVMNVEVSDGLNGSEVIPEPTEKNWYIELQSRTDAALNGAEAALANTAAILGAIGSPTTAATAAAMVDETKIYVYTGSETGYVYGDWYYYDSTEEEWVDGGAYNATAVVTDPTGTQAGVPADAKAVQDNIDELKTDVDGLTTTVNGKNLINPDTLTVGRMKTDGTVESLSSYRTSDYILLEPGSYVLGRLNLVTNEVLAPSYLGYGLYNLDKTFVADSRVYNNYEEATTLSIIVSEKKYIRVTGTKNNFEKANSTGSFILSAGTQLTEWKAYREPVKYAVLTSRSIDDVLPAVPEKNLYNKDTDKPQNGIYYNSANGTIVESENHAVTGKTPIEPNTQYIFKAGSVNVVRASFFKGDGGYTHVSSLSRSSIENGFTSPADAEYVGFTLFGASHTEQEYKTAIASAQLEKGSIATAYEPYKEKRVYTMPASQEDVGKALSVKTVRNGKVTEWDLQKDTSTENVITQNSLVNVYDKSLAEDGKIFNAITHGITSNASYGISGFVPVKPNTHYNISIDKSVELGNISSWYYEFDSSKTFIQSSQQNQSTTFLDQVWTGETTTYILFNLLFHGEHTEAQFNALIDTIMVCEGTQRPLEYIPFNYEPVIDHTKIDNAYHENADRFRGKKWLVTGTSVSYQDSKAYTEGVAEGEIVRGYIGNITRRKPMLVKNEAISGSTLADTTQNTALINRYQNLDFANYDFITIEYGINDFGRNVPVGTAEDAAGTSTFAACLKTIIEYALTQNPIVGLIICTEPCVRDSTNSVGATLQDYADVTLAIAKQYRLPVCDWFYHSGINAMTKGDGSSRYSFTQAGTHPSVYGHMRMGAMLNQVFDSLLC